MRDRTRSSSRVNRFHALFVYIGAEGCGCRRPKYHATKSSTNKATDNPMRMVNELTIAFFDRCFLKIRKINPDPRLARIAMSNITINILMIMKRLAQTMLRALIK
jgi:hypothetical protein